MAGNGLGSAAVPRGARRLTLRFERQEAFADQYAQHLAKGGAFVATDESFTLREVVEVQLDLVFASQFLSLAAEVVHCLTPDQAPDGVEPGVAVQFLDPATVLRERFAPFLEASEPPPPPPRATRRRPPEPAPDPGETRVLDSLDADPPTATLDSMPLAPARNWEAGDDSELASLGDPSEVSFEGLGPAEDLTDGGAELVGDPVEGFETNSVAETDERTFIERAVREPARLPVEIRGPTGAALRGRTRNVSDTGVLISVDGEELPIGREVQLNLIHPRTGEHVTVPGRVTRHVQGEGIVAAVGVQLNPSAGGRDEVDQFLGDVREIERRYKDQGIRGPLQELGARSLLQMFPALAPRGTLTVMSGAEEGTIAFEGSQLLLAEVGSVDGIKALARILSWREGYFEFRAQLDATTRDRPVTSLERAVEKALSMIEAEDTTIGPSLSADQRFEVSHSSLENLDRPLTKGEEAVVELAAADFTLRRIMDVIPENDAQVRAAVLSLCERGVLEPIY